jgi:hypothetical protein
LLQLDCTSCEFEAIQLAPQSQPLTKYPMLLLQARPSLLFSAAVVLAVLLSLFVVQLMLGIPNARDS